MITTIWTSYNVLLSGVVLSPIYLISILSIWPTVEQVTSIKLLSDIGFKTKVCLDNALEILEAWVHCGDSFKSRYGYEAISTLCLCFKHCLLFFINEFSDFDKIHFYLFPFHIITNMEVLKILFTVVHWIIYS